MKSVNDKSFPLNSRLVVEGKKPAVEGCKSAVGRTVLAIRQFALNFMLTMERNQQKWYRSELFFQVILHLAAFLFYAYDRNTSDIPSYTYAFFLTYALAAFFINYYLLGSYFYQKRYRHFIIGVLLTIGLVIVAEELILEPIYFPDTRARSFPGLMMTLIPIIPVFTILVGFKFGWDALAKQNEVENLRMMAKESELGFLKSQINPHFLFNNLNNLYAYAIENSPKTPEIILELSGVLRYMLYDCQVKYVPLNTELKQLENFIRLSSMQIEDRGTVNYKLDEVGGTYQIAPLILVVFIENAFKHSTASQTADIHIEVKTHLDQAGMLHFVCTNTYRTQSNTTSLSKGIGLENVRKRLELLYPDQHQLDISQDEPTYEVALRLQLHQNGAL